MQYPYSHRITKIQYFEKYFQTISSANLIGKFRRVLVKEKNEFVSLMLLCSIVVEHMCKKMSAKKMDRLSEWYCDIQKT